MSAFSSERSRPIFVDIAISAPARSIEEQATSTSRLRITSRIEMWCTSTSYIDISSESGSIPWLIVRLPCGSRSTHSTRWPLSANAAARLSVVVVFATPPFWLAKAMTLAVGSPFSAGVSDSGVTADSDRSGRSAGTASVLRSKRPISQCVFVRAGRNPPASRPVLLTVGPDGRPPRQAAGVRDRQGRRREDDRRRRARPRRRAPGKRDVVVRGGGRSACRASSARGRRLHETSSRGASTRVGRSRASEGEWLRYQLKSRAARRRAASAAGCSSTSRPPRPGSRELVTIGKVWDLAQLERARPEAAPYDLAIVDAPATGHGLAMLRAPSTYATIARVGPIRRQAREDRRVPARPGVTPACWPSRCPRRCR